VRIQLHGYEVQVTLRDHDEAALLARLEALFQRYPKPAPPAQPTVQGQGQAPIKDWCTKHQTRMKRHEKEGRYWFSHYVDGVHCKGK
jgi:hypothetical protein